MHEMAKELLDAGERAFIDQVIAGKASAPAICWAFWKPSRIITHATIFPWKRCSMLPRKRRLRPRRSLASPRFTRLFNLQPQGDNTVCICRGTACHTRGSRICWRVCSWSLGWDAGRLERRRRWSRQSGAQTTADQKFTVRTVACFGQCALAPVVEINHNICGHVNEHTLQRQLRDLERESK